MVFELRDKEDNFVDGLYAESMKELDEFFELDWKYDKPKIILVENRSAINQLKGKETERWVVGWTDGNRTVYLLCPENFERESNHKFSKESYGALMKHELAHCFTSTVSRGCHKPYWLREGISIYLAGQNNLNKRPEKFGNFLEYYGVYDSGIYQESGFALEFLVEKYGKEKLLDLVKKSGEAQSEEQFENLFKEIYGFELKYENFIYD